MTADLPESDYTPSDTLLPATPDGYQDPELFEYPLAYLISGGVLLLPLATLLFGVVRWTVQGPAVFEALVVITETPTELTFFFNWPLIVGVTTLALGVTVIVHEFVHGVVFGRYGYRVSYGAMPQIGAFYATPFHQFVAREHVFRVALAPLLISSLVGLPLLAVPVPLVAFFVFQVLVVNAVGAAGDLYRWCKASAWGLEPEGEADASITHGIISHGTVATWVNDLNPKQLRAVTEECDTSQHTAPAGETGVVGRGGAADPHGRAGRSGVTSSRPVPGRSRGVKFACVCPSVSGRDRQHGEASGLVPGVLHIVAYLLRKPAGTLTYDSDIRHSYVFESASS